MTLTLAQLRQIKRIQLQNADLPIMVIFKHIKGFHSLLLEQLMFRLQNHSQPVYIFLMDGQGVTVRDTQVGAFLETDIGLPKSIVLRDRYSGFFPNVQLFHTASESEVLTILERQGNRIIPLVFIENDISTSAITNKLNETKNENAVMFSHSRSREGSHSISIRVFRSGVTYGGADVEHDAPATRAQFAKQYTENALIAQRIFNVINEYVAGNTFTLRGLEGDILSENMRPLHFLGKLWEGFISKYSYLFEGLNYEQSVLQEVADWFDTFQEDPTVMQELADAVERFPISRKNIVKAQVGFLLQGLNYYRSTISADTALHERVRVITGLLLKLNSDGAETHFRDDYMPILLAYIQFIKKEVYYEQIF